VEAPRHKRTRHQLRPAEIDHGHICEVEPKAGTGCIETRDGRIVRFYKESLDDETMEKLTTGTEVRFTAEPHGKGHRAITVHVID
jgi:cold shock CspA family protein